MLKQLKAISIGPARLRCAARALFVLALLVFPLLVPAQGLPQAETSADTIEIQEMPEMEVIAFGKTVIIRKQAKGVFVFGGDVVIHGTVTGDVGVIGGNLIQKRDAHIGGDVIVIGGAYKPEADTPGRAAGKETVVFGVYEEQLRKLLRDPAQMLSPTPTPVFFAGRVLAVLFWFAITLAFTTVAPGAVSRAIARTQLSALKVAGLGLGGLIGTVMLVIVSASWLPDGLSMAVWAMGFSSLLLAYVFGRIVLQLLVGKAIQRFFFPGRSHPESLAMLYGVVVWTAFLSIPYVWVFVLLTLFAAGVGLVLTAGGGNGWRTA